jgi:hypothetical protein
MRQMGVVLVGVDQIPLEIEQSRRRAEALRHTGAGPHVDPREDRGLNFRLEQLGVGGGLDVAGGKDEMREDLFGGTGHFHECRRVGGVAGIVVNLGVLEKLLPVEPRVDGDFAAAQARGRPRFRCIGSARQSLGRGEVDGVDGHRGVVRHAMKREARVRVGL